MSNETTNPDDQKVKCNFDPSDPNLNIPSVPGGAVLDCPCACPTDITLVAPCKILQVKGGPVKMFVYDGTAQPFEKPPDAPGTYEWKTTSTKIKLSGADSNTVEITPLDKPSDARDAETITITRTATGCAPIVKTVKVTVAQMTFSASPSQKYGYDDFDTPADHTDDHVSVEQNKFTFLKVDIVGGAVSSDFDFVCDADTICKAFDPPGVASFDLRLEGQDQKKAETTLRAKVKCPSKEEFAKIQVHVYKQKVVEVVVGKFFDSTQAGTNLRHKDLDYAAFEPDINKKMQEAVVKFTITNFDPANKAIDLRFDLDNSGNLTYDMADGGGPEYRKIQAAMTGTGTKFRVAIVHTMTSFYRLAAAANKGDTKITVTAGTAYGSVIPKPLGAPPTQEMITTVSAGGNALTVSPALRFNHAAGEILEFPAAAWSGNPIVITDDRADADNVRWTVAHEVGHIALTFADVNDTNSIMNFHVGWTDHRLRYCPRTKNYDPTQKENQWETVPRDP